MSAPPSSPGGHGMVDVDYVPEVGDSRDGAFVGYAVVRNVYEGPDPYFGQPTTRVTALGYDGAAGGDFTVSEFNRAYPWMRGMRAEYKRAMGIP